MGDVLVVILIYCFVRAFFTFSIKTAALGTLCFAFGVEFLQAFNAVGILGLQDSKLARTVIGTSFSWLDLLTYVVGIIIVLAAERQLSSIYGSFINNFAKKNLGRHGQ